MRRLLMPLVSFVLLAGCLGESTVGRSGQEETAEESFEPLPSDTAQGEPTQPDQSTSGPAEPVATTPPAVPVTPSPPAPQGVEIVVNGFRLLVRPLGTTTYIQSRYGTAPPGELYVSVEVEVTNLEGDRSLAGLIAVGGILPARRPVPEGDACNVGRPTWGGFCSEMWLQPELPDLGPGETVRAELFFPRRFSEEYAGDPHNFGILVGLQLPVTEPRHRGVVIEVDGGEMHQLDA